MGRSRSCAECRGGAHEEVIVSCAGHLVGVRIGRGVEMGGRGRL